MKPPGYATGSEVEHFERFCRDQLVQSVDRWNGEPLELYPAQFEFFNEALAFDEHGLPIGGEGDRQGGYRPQSTRRDRRGRAAKVSQFGTAARDLCAALAELQRLPVKTSVRPAAGPVRSRLGARP